MSELNIYQRINEIRKAVDYIQKDKSVSTGSGSYKAVTHDAVTAILRKHLIEHGVVCVPNQIEGEMFPKEGEAKQGRYEGRYSFDFVNCDKPDDKITIVLEAHAMDNADKAPGKAISYAKKYAVLKLFEIETGEDEESRYQAESVDYMRLVKSIDDCVSMVELKTIYAQSAKACGSDKEALKYVIKAKDSKKAYLAKGVKDETTN